MHVAGVPTKSNTVIARGKHFDEIKLRPTNVRTDDMAVDFHGRDRHLVGILSLEIKAVCRSVGAMMRVRIRMIPPNQLKPARLTQIELRPPCEQNLLRTEFD